MDQQDLDLIEKHSREDQELAALYKEHVDFDRKITRMERRPFLNGDEKEVLAQLKKKKLAGRDKIQKKLNVYRSNGAASQE